MHGRVKVRSSEEEKIRKEKERQLKLKLFQNVMGKIQYKRSMRELDKEMLGLTAQLLAGNPDIYTLWNIRREVLESISKNNTESDDLSKLYDSELSLTECCLKVNPKSYCAWHQREWILKTRDDPDWKKELDLCNLYLKYDERNFHVWDYRRFIVSQDKTPLEDEFKYTTEKIHENFSNYSAWHYRSKLLVQLYPDTEGGRPIADSQHKNELQLVQNAAFTDPDDTSAWFYQRWLLGAVKKVKQLINCVMGPEITTVTFNTSVNKDEMSRVNVYSSDEEIDTNWRSASGSEYDFVWVTPHIEKILKDMRIKVVYDAKEGRQELDCDTYEGGAAIYFSKYVGTAEFSFHNNFSKPVIEELKKQLDTCHQLLALEPNSKWTLLTTTFMMHCCNRTENLNACLKNLAQLKSIDHLRCGYYEDLASKWIIEDCIEKNKFESGTFSLLGHEYPTRITYLPHMHYLSRCRTVDLSSQHLTSSHLPALSALQHCEYLSLQNNQITHLRSMPRLPSLTHLVMKDNPITNEELLTFKELCPRTIEIE